jgi:murein DD-endopeptidase MepM/ murein hydrolase activator NlpD
VTATSFDRASRAAAVARASTAFAVALAVALFGAEVVGAQTTGGGGTAPPGNPVITDVLCVTKCIKPRKGVVGSKMRIIGDDLEYVRVVSLPRSDGKRAKDTSPYVKPSGAVIAYVKRGSVTGAVRVADPYRSADAPTAFKLGTMAQLRRVRQRYRFPVPGPHQYWDGLGASRGHQGQDIGAACKSRVIVAHSGRVIARSGSGPEGAAGNYVMIWNKRDNRTHTYMHLFNSPAVALGAAVTTGQFLGKVGQTGRASGCHLHFELRAGRGWGQVLNPTPSLRAWDKYS